MPWKYFKAKFSNSYFHRYRFSCIIVMLCVLIRHCVIPQSTSVPWKYFETMYLLQIYGLAHIIVGLWLQCRVVDPQGLALLTLSLDKNWDSHSPMNGYPSFYPRIALVAPSPGHICVYWHKQEKHYFYMIITGNITVFLFAMSPIRFQSYLLTLKRLGHFFQNVILFSNVVHHKCNIFIWNWTDTMNVWSALWMLMAWCFSTRASVATVLTTHPCVSRCLWVKTTPTHRCISKNDCMNIYS